MFSYNVVTKTRNQPKPPASTNKTNQNDPKPSTIYPNTTGVCDICVDGRCVTITSTGHLRKYHTNRSYQGILQMVLGSIGWFCWWLQVVFGRFGWFGVVLAGSVFQYVSHKASSAILPHWPTRYPTTMHQEHLFINETYRDKQCFCIVEHSTKIIVQQQRINGDKYGARTTLRDPQDMGAKPRCGKCLPQSWRRYRNGSCGDFSITRKKIALKSLFFFFCQTTMWITAAFLRRLGMSLVSRRYEFWRLMELLW